MWDVDGSVQSSVQNLTQPIVIYVLYEQLPIIRNEGVRCSSHLSGTILLLRRKSPPITPSRRGEQVVGLEAVDEVVAAVEFDAVEAGPVAGDADEAGHGLAEGFGVKDVQLGRGGAGQVDQAVEDVHKGPSKLVAKVRGTGVRAAGS